MLRIFYAIALILSATMVVQAQQEVQFVNPIPVPYKVTGPNFTFNVSAAQHNFDPNGAVTGAANRFGQPLTPVNINNAVEAYCYNTAGNTGMTYLGPTLVVQKGDQLNFDITNNLPGGQRTTVHWHGLNLPASADGGPHQVIGNGETWNSNFRMIDPAQTVWYHSHLMDSTTEQVVRGTAGMMIVEDPGHPAYLSYPREYGVNDFPIIIQEKDFNFDNSATPMATEIKAGKNPGNGRFTLVNGVVGGVQHVPQSMVRLRLLNGSPRKMYGLGIATDRDNPSFITMYQIATGGGYVERVQFVDSTLLSVGDRKDFIVDFTPYSNGDTVYMINCYLPTDALYLDGMPLPTSRMPASADRAIMAFVIDNSIAPSPPVFAIPVIVDSNYDLAPGDVFQTRTKELRKDPNPNGPGSIWTINGDTMNMMVINDTVLVNTKERWIIENKTNHAHPFHIHKVQFQVVEYSGKLGFSDDSTYHVIDPTDPMNFPEELLGWKDVQLVRANATMTFEARFDSFPSPAISPMEGFMYHCHILTHEDNSMMGQFVVVDSLAYYTNTNNVSITKSLFVYPNPAGDMISFDAANLNESGTLRIYNMTGQMLREENNMFLSGRTLDVSDLPRGMIFVEFRTEKDRYLQKVLLR